MYTWITTIQIKIQNFSLFTRFVLLSFPVNFHHYQERLQFWYLLSLISFACSWWYYIDNQILLCLLLLSIIFLKCFHIRQTSIYCPILQQKSVHFMSQFISSFSCWWTFDFFLWCLFFFYFWLLWLRHL